MSHKDKAGLRHGLVVFQASLTDPPEKIATAYREAIMRLMDSWYKQSGAPEWASTQTVSQVLGRKGKLIEDIKGEMRKKGALLYVKYSQQYPMKGAKVAAAAMKLAMYYHGLPAQWYELNSALLTGYDTGLVSKMISAHILVIHRAFQPNLDSQWATRVMDAVLASRIGEKPTILTSTMKPTDISTIVGAEIAAIVRQNATVVEVGR